MNLLKGYLGVWIFSRTAEEKIVKKKGYVCERLLMSGEDLTLEIWVAIKGWDYHYYYSKHLLPEEDWDYTYQIDIYVEEMEA